MIIAFNYNTKASCHLLDKQRVQTGVHVREIPRLSYVNIESAGVADDGTIICDGKDPKHGLFSLYIHPPLPGNINFLSDPERLLGYSYDAHLYRRYCPVRGLRALLCPKNPVAEYLEDMPTDR